MYTNAPEAEQIAACQRLLEKFTLKSIILTAPNIRAEDTNDGMTAKIHCDKDSPVS